MSRRRPPSILGANGVAHGVVSAVRRMSPGSATGSVANTAPVKDTRVRSTVLPAPAPTGGGGGTSSALDFTEYKDFTGISLATGSTEYFAWDDSMLYGSASHPAWLTYTAGGETLELTQGQYVVMVEAYTTAVTGPIGMSVEVSTTNGAPTHEFEQALTLVRDNYRAGTLTVHLVESGSNISFSVTVFSGTLSATATVKAQMTVERLGDVT